MVDCLNVFFELVGLGGLMVIFQENFHHTNFALHCKDTVLVVNDGFSHVYIE